MCTRLDFCFSCRDWTWDTIQTLRELSCTGRCEDDYEWWITRMNAWEFMGYYVFFAKHAREQLLHWWLHLSIHLHTLIQEPLNTFSQGSLNTRPLPWVWDTLNAELPHLVWGTLNVGLPHLVWGTLSVWLPHLVWGTLNTGLPHLVWGTMNAGLPYLVWGTLNAGLLHLVWGTLHAGLPHLVWGTFIRAVSLSTSSSLLGPDSFNLYTFSLGHMTTLPVICLHKQVYSWTYIFQPWRWR